MSTEAYPIIDLRGRISIKALRRMKRVPILGKALVRWYIRRKLRGVLVK